MSINIVNLTFNRFTQEEEEKVLWESKPFGESPTNEDVDQDNTKFTLNLRFPGQYFDKETQTHYNINRDYNPVTGRYIQSDPIGFDGGVNGFAYVGGMPVLNVDNYGLATYIISNINGGYIFGWGGTHTGLIVINDKNPFGDKSFLYDPSGSYSAKTNWGTRQWLGSGRLQYYDEDIPINITDYYNYQLEDGSDVRLYYFNTTESDEKIILREAELWGGGSGFDCTDSISYILSKTNKFKNIEQVTLPLSLANQLDEL